jgi:hypothetical protein
MCHGLFFLEHIIHELNYKGNFGHNKVLALVYQISTSLNFHLSNEESFG